MLEFVSGLNQSDLIAFGAMLVSILSAMYSSRSWLEDRRANRLTLLITQQEIFDAFYAVAKHMEQKAEFADFAVVTGLHRSRLLAPIYLPASLSPSFVDYYEACFTVADRQRTHPGLHERAPEIDEALRIERELAPEIERDLLAIMRDGTNFRAGWWDRTKALFTRKV